YGPDNQQGYMLLRLAKPRANSRRALYLIPRGNPRAYLHAERLDADPPLGDRRPTAPTLLRRLREEGQLHLHGLGEPQSEWTRLLVRALSLDATLRVALSGPHAAAWRDALVAERLRAGRLELGAEEADGLRVQLLR